MGEALPDVPVFSGVTIPEQPKSNKPEQQITIPGKVVDFAAAREGAGKTISPSLAKEAAPARPGQSAQLRNTTRVEKTAALWRKSCKNQAPESGKLLSGTLLPSLDLSACGSRCGSNNFLASQISQKITKIRRNPKKSTDLWSEWRDLNPRPHGPEPCALPTALHPDTMPKASAAFSAVVERQHPTCLL